MAVLQAQRTSLLAPAGPQSLPVHSSVPPNPRSDRRAREEARLLDWTDLQYANCMVRCGKWDGIMGPAATTAARSLRAR